MPRNLCALLPATQSSCGFFVETSWGGDSGGRGRGEDVWNVAEQQGSKEEHLEPEGQNGSCLGAAHKTQKSQQRPAPHSLMPPPTDEDVKALPVMPARWKTRI